MKICILYGGTSTEREVSLNTGESIYNAICDDYDIVMHDWNGDYQLMHDVVKGVDLVFIALHGGDGEDGTIQKFLESKNIKFTGSPSKASKVAMSKNTAKNICDDYKIPTPSYQFCVSDFKLSSAKRFFKEALKFKNGYVVKPNKEGSSIGVSIIPKVINGLLNKDYNSEQVFIDAWGKAKKQCINVSVEGWPTLVEEYIEGRELTVSVLAGKILPIVEILPKGDYYDYKSKYTKHQSDYVVPAEISDEIEELLSEYSLKIHKLIGCGVYSRVDFRLSKDCEIYFLEINTLPGFTDTSLFPKSAKAAGLKYKDLIKKIIKIT